MKPFNHHTHTHFCDGTSEPLEYWKAAQDKEFSSFGFSSHAPLPLDVKWSMKKKDLQLYAKTIRALKAKGKTEGPFLSLEMDYIPGMVEDFSYLRNLFQLDYVIGAVHLVVNPKNKQIWFIDGPREGYDKGLHEVFGGDIKTAVSCYFHQLARMVQSQKPNILAHMDKVLMNNCGRYFSGNEKWYIKLIDYLLEECRKNDCIIEVNTRGKYKGKVDNLFPSEKMLHRIHSMGLDVTISTDAHDPSEIDLLFQDTALLLKDIGFEKVMRFTHEGWKAELI